MRQNVRTENAVLDPSWYEIYTVLTVNVFLSFQRNKQMITA